MAEISDELHRAFVEGFNSGDECGFGEAVDRGLAAAAPLIEQQVKERTRAGCPSVGVIEAAIADPGSVLPRVWGESTNQWSARAIVALLEGKED